MTAYRLTSLPGWIRKAHRPSNWTRYHSFYQQATQRPSNLVEFTERFRRSSYPAARRGDSLDTFVAHAQMYIGVTPDHAVTFGTIYRDAQDQPGLSPDS